MSLFLAFTVFLVLLIGAGLFLIVNTYNNLVHVNKQVDRSWANIDVVLQQRFEEVSSLVKVVEQFANYEKDLVQKVVEARAQYGQAKAVDDKVKAANDMSLALKGIFAIGENYPELKSSQNFIQLQERVSSLEDTIADRRELFNDSVTIYNTRIEQIPDVFIARMLGYSQKTMYKVEEALKQKPSLDMNLNV